MLVEQSRKMMGTVVGVHVAAAPEQEDDARKSVAACFAWLEDVAARLTRFDAASELSQLNAAAGAWCAVSELLFTVLEQSLAAARASDGLFDPALLGLLEALGYDRDFKAIVGANPRREVQGTRCDALPASTAGAWREIQLDAVRRRVRLPLGARLDLGGIVKGWAADVAIERFFAPDVGALVDVGGDMRVHGRKDDGELWPIGISADADESAAPEADAGIVVTLGRGGMAGSGASGRWWYSDGARQHHLIDPRTARPARLWIDAGDDLPGGDPLIASAAALAPTAAHAEVAAKVALLRGYPTALRAIETAWATWVKQAEADGAAPPAYGDAGVALVLVLGSGEVACSENLRAYLDGVGGGGDIWLP